MFDFNENGGSLTSACAKLRLLSALVIGVESDFLFPIHQQRELADHISGSVEKTKFVSLDCIKGHDSFLVEMDAFRPVISEFMAKE